MSENTESSQTLKSALEAEGSYDQANLLATDESANLTKQDLINLVNGVNLTTISTETKGILRTISVMRVQQGQPVFPWNDAAFLNSLADYIPDPIKYIY